jgi:hypothetical protein
VDRARQNHRRCTSHILPASHAAFCTDHTVLDRLQALIWLKYFSLQIRLNGAKPTTQPIIALKGKLGKSRESRRKSGKPKEDQGSLQRNLGTTRETQGKLSKAGEKLRESQRKLRNTRERHGKPRKAAEKAKESQRKLGKHRYHVDATR